MSVSALLRPAATSLCHHLRVPAVALLAAQLLAACAGHAPKPVDEARVAQFAARGYLSEGRFPIEQRETDWDHGGHVVPLSWTVPITGTHLPIVIYLPGLGESAAAGQAYRLMWSYDKFKDG